MGHPSAQMAAAPNSRFDRTVSRKGLLVWLSVAVFALLLATCAVVGRIVAGPRFDGLLILAACAAALLLAIRIPLRRSAALAVRPPLQDVLESVGPAILTAGLDGRLLYVNPAAERLLGCDSAQLIGEWRIADVLPPRESARLLAEMQKLCGLEPQPEPAPEDGLSAFIDCVRALPPSQMPSFDTELRRSSGETFSVTLQVSALRGEAGSIAGLVFVALDRGGTLRSEQDLRESQERYRDLFETSNEMIATLSPAGRFLYANPAWRKGFGLDNAALLALDSFEDLFGASCRAEVAGHFRHVLDGSQVDRLPLRHFTLDGRLQEFELSLSQRQKAGKPLAIRCLLRDVTQQKQREHRLSLQLAINEILAENAGPEVACVRVLEALCISQGWDLAFKWIVNAKDNRLEFSTSWGAPGSDLGIFVKESMALSLGKGIELPGRAWNQGRAVWVSDLESIPASPRTLSARRQKLASGWAVPVRVGNVTLAVLEFYSSYRLRENRESTAAIEIAASALGQMLARSRERGRADELSRQQEILLDSVADGICGVDGKGLVRFANPAAARLLGAHVSTLTGRPVHDLLHGAAPEKHACGDDCALRRAASRQAASSGEDVVYRLDGTSFPAEYSLTPILDQGHFSGFVLSFRDISQRNALDRMKDEFISTVSHELRTPLTSIRGALGLLSSGMLGTVNEKARNLLRIALTNSERLVRLINDILDLERIQSGREPLTFRSVQLADIIRQAIGDMQPVADAAGVRLIHDATQIEIDADPYRLLQVLTNLLSNAVKFSPRDSTVSIMLRPGVNGVTLSVIDHGRGIPADKLETIFGRFQQVDASDSRQKGGSGLGLAICRTIVLQHSGRIWAERNPVRGATFRVFLPYHPVPLEMPAAAPQQESGEGTVLVAGGNADVRLRITAPLTRHGFRVVEASTAEQAVTAARNGVQAVLLHTSLGSIDAWETLSQLHRLPPEIEPPVVLLNLDLARSSEEPANGSGDIHDLPLRGLAGGLAGSGEKVRILVVEQDRDLAAVAAGVFAGRNATALLVHTLNQATDACLTFKPHLVVLDIGLPGGEGFNFVDWLRREESLPHIPLAVYSGRDFSPVERRRLDLGPVHFLTQAAIQPQQLEALVLTMLRTSRQMEEVTAQS